MDKKQVAEFFDNLAEVWDIDMVKNQSKVLNTLYREQVAVPAVQVVQVEAAEFQPVLMQAEQL